MLISSIVCSVTTAIVCFLFSRAVGLTLSFVIFCALNASMYYYLAASSAGGWFIVLVQFPAAFVGLISIVLGAATKPKNLQPESFPYPELKRVPPDKPEVNRH